MKRSLSLLTVAFFIFAVPCAFAEPLPQLVDSDRILILAPHPDDEAIGAAGVIQSALSRNLPVKIVYLTNGDSNELAFIIYEKRLVFKQSGVLAMGKLRHDEAVTAMSSLGLSPENMIFLGYPDAGTLTMFQQYWGITTTPYKSLLTRVRSVPYQYSYSFGAPYVGESILRDLKKILAEYKPTRIFVSHPMDNNPDHRAFYLFLRVALWDLGKQIDPPQIYPYLIHEARWPLPRGFHPDLALTPSDQINDSQIRWFESDLTPEQIEKKRAAIALYKSQVEYNPPYLFTFARRNELFGDYPPIVIPNHPQGKIEWQETEVNHHAGVVPTEEASQASAVLSSLAYARQGKFLYIRVTPQTWNDKLLGVNLNVLGYRRGLPFSHMPKYHLKITFSKFVAVYEKGKRVFVKDMEVKRFGKEIVIKFPLDSLENPHYILSSARSYLKNTDIDRTAWRVLVIEQP
jgi:LmbE family N-acetylglucosaminyl deacetylase